MLLIGKPSISMGHGFHSYVSLPEGSSQGSKHSALWIPRSAVVVFIGQGPILNQSSRWVYKKKWGIQHTTQVMMCNHVYTSICIIVVYIYIYISYIYISYIYIHIKGYNICIYIISNHLYGYIYI